MNGLRTGSIVVLFLGLHACASIAAPETPAPLPPGVKPVAGQGAKGMYLHAKSNLEFYNPSTGAKTGERASEVWLYRSGHRYAAYVCEPGCREVGAPRTGGWPPRADASLDISFNLPFARHCIEGAGCTRRKIAGIDVACRVDIGGDSCVSISPGPSKGLVFHQGFAGDSFELGGGADVDQVIEHAMINPAVFPKD